MKRGKPLERKTEMNRGEGPKRKGWWNPERKRIKPVSDKKLAEKDENAEVREAVLKRDGHKCRIAPFLPDTECHGPMTYHHLSKASAGGKYTIENGITACAFHNDWVEDFPHQAKMLGLVRRPPTEPWRPLTERDEDGS